MYTPLSYDDILNAILTDFANQIPGADTSAGSDIRKKAVALASAVWGLYSRLDYINNQTFPNTADSDGLARHAATYGITREAASFAAGNITFTGTDGTVVPAGTKAVDASGVEVATAGAGTIAGGTLTVAAQTTVPGAVGNMALGDALTVEGYVAGLDGTATVAAGGFTGGADAESDPSLLARLLNHIQQPPAGGNANDYAQWALAVPGVASAYVYPLRQGLGTVTVVVLTSGSGAARIPGAPLVTAVFNAIDPVRPVCDKYVQVLAPTAHAQALTANLKINAAYNTATVQAAVTTAVTALFDALAPLETLVLSKLLGTVTAVDGVDDAAIAVPAANVVPVDDGLLVVEMMTLGAITYGVLV